MLSTCVVYCAFCSTGNVRYGDYNTSVSEMLSELDLKSLWRELDDYDLEVDTESRLLQEVWLKIAELKGGSGNGIEE